MCKSTAIPARLRFMPFHLQVNTDSLSAASNGSDRNRFPLRGNDKHSPYIEEPLIPHSPFIGRKQVFGLMKQSAYKDNAIGRVDETRALRTNRIWSKGRVEYTKLTVPSVNLRNLRLKILRVSSFLRGEKISVYLCNLWRSRTKY
jgi:hypothetical protein